MRQLFENGRRLTVVMDLDGVLARTAERIHNQLLIPQGERDWARFYAGLHDAEPDPGWVAFTNLLYGSGYDLQIVTSRPYEHSHDVTQRWLEKAGVYYSGLNMRLEWPFESFKEMWVDRMPAQRDYKIVLAVDDEPHVVNMYRRKGIPTIHVPSGFNTWRPDPADV